MSDIDIITDILNSYSGLPDFHIDKINCTEHPHTDIYHIYFNDYINFRFLVKRDADLNVLCGDIHIRYLDESQDLGIGSK